MENNNKKGWTSRRINRALLHLCQNGVPSSTDDERRWVGNTPSLLSLGRCRRQSIPAWRWHGNKAGMARAVWVVFSLTGAASPQNRVIDAGALHKAPVSFPRGSGAGGDLRAEIHLPIVAGGFQDASLEMKTSYPKRHGTRFSPLCSSKMEGEIGKGKRMGSAGRLPV